MEVVMSDKKKKKKVKPVARTQSCMTQQEPSPALPPRPPGGLRGPRASMSFDGDNHPPIIPHPAASLPASISAFSGTPSFAIDSSDVAPPVPTSPRPNLGAFVTKPPVSLPPQDDIPPPLPPPICSPRRKRSSPAHSQPSAAHPSSSRAQPPSQAQSPTTPLSTSTDPRYIQQRGLATPSISANSVLSDDQLRAQIEMQTQNTAELSEMIQGHEDEAISPVVLAGKYGKYFPFRVCVVKGFYNKRAEIVAGEIYNVHFLKNARVIAITDTMGDKYILPLNAAMRIGFEQKNQPPCYYNVLDIINSTDPPKLISPQSDFKASEGNSFQCNEVLLVKGVHVSRVRRLKSLRVVNIKSSEEKTIPCDCPVHFSTDPMFTQLTLSDAVHKVPELIPGNARLYPTVDVEDMGFPGHLVSETVKVRRQYLERSLITTLEEQEPRPSDPFSLSEPVEPVKTIYDLPISLDIEFSILPPEPEEDLYAYTHMLSQQFDPRKLQSADGLGLNMALDEDNIYSGVELELPSYINCNPAAPKFRPPQGIAESSVPPPLPARQPSHKAHSDGEEYSEIDFTPNSSLPDVPPPLPASLPPTLRPVSAPSPPMTCLPPSSSHRPQQGTGLETPPTPTPTPTPRAQPRDHTPSTVQKPEKCTSPTCDSDEYVDIDDEISNRGTTHPPSLPSSLPPSAAPRPYKYPLISILPKSSKASPESSPASAPLKPADTTPTPIPLSDSASSANGGVGPPLATRERSPNPRSPVSSNGSYEDTAELVQARPRLPSPLSVTETSDGHEIMQQFSDLQNVVQSARKKAQQQSSPSHTTSELKRLLIDLNRVSAFPQKIINHCMVLEREVSTLQDVVKEELIKTSSSDAIEENRKFLSTLTIPQIIKMLEMMNMKKYQDRFSQEGIDGAILMDVEEQTLQSELGVTSKLDRVKLMKIIRGERSAKSVLEGQYNYVALQPK